MGDWSWTIVDVEVTAADAAMAGERAVRALITRRVVLEEQDRSGGALLWPPGSASGSTTRSGERPVAGVLHTGIELVTGRTVFDTGGNGVELACGACKGSLEPDDRYFEQVGEWHEGDDHVIYACPLCGSQTRLVDWDGPFAFALGNLGIRLWNWPRLSDEFVREMSSVLGHRIRLVHTLV